MSDTLLFSTQPISIYENIKKTLASHSTLQDIFKHFESEGLKNKIAQLQSLPIDEQKEYKKQHLKIFSPCLFQRYSRSDTDPEDIRSTQIIQFDIDEISESDSLRIKAELIAHCPELLYAFISPRGGLKLAVATDYDEVEGFEFAYDMAKEYVLTLIPGTELDEACRSIRQTCMYSYDPDYFLNKAPEILEVKDQALALLAEKRKQEAIQEQNRIAFDQAQANELSIPTKIDPSEIEKALAKCPQNYRYNQRRDFTWALYAATEQNAGLTISLLSSHWSRCDAEKSKKQTQQFIKDYQQKLGGIGPGTFWQTAKQNGYEFPQGRKLLPVATTQPPTFNAERYDLKTASQLLEQCTESFFQNKQSVIINFEAGAGKTHLLRKSIFDALFENKKFRAKVEIHVRSHETAQEYEQHFNELLEKQISGFSSIQEKIQGPMLNMQMHSRIQYIQGRYKLDDEGNYSPDESLCKHALLLTGDDEDKKLFDGNTSAFCAACPLRSNCEYVEQFTTESLYPVQVRIYAHAQLFCSKSYWAEGLNSDEYGLERHSEMRFDPDFIIVDEDIIGQVFDRKNIYDSSYDYGTPAIKSIINEMHTGNAVLEDCILKYADQIEDDYAQQKKEWQEYDKHKSDGINFGGITADEIKKNYRAIAKPEYNKVLVAINRYLKILKDSAYAGYKWIHIYFEAQNNNGFGRDRIVVADHQRLNYRYEDKPMMILDASADETLWQEIDNKIFHKHFEFKNIRVNYADNVKVFQYGDCSFSRRWFQTDLKARVKQVAKMIKAHAKDRKIGLITYRNLNGFNDFYEKLGKAVGALHSGYFGNVRGLNKFEDVEVLFIIGRHNIGQAGETQFKQLNSEIIFAEDFELNTVRQKTEEVYRMKSGQHFSKNHQVYQDSILQALVRQFNKGETYQSAHRLRMIHGSHLKELYLFTDEVLDITVDELLTKDKKKYVADTIVAEITEAIELDGCLQDKNSVIAKRIGRNATQIAYARKSNQLKEVVNHTDIQLIDVMCKDSNRNRTKKSFFKRSNYQISNDDLGKGYSLVP